MNGKVKVGSMIVISQPDEDFVCEVKRIVKNPKCNGLRMDYYLLDSAHTDKEKG